MTSHCDSHTTTDVKLEMKPGIQIRNGIPHDKFNLCRIAHARTSIKVDIFLQRWLYIDKAHMTLDIFRLAVFFSYLIFLSYTVI